MTHDIALPILEFSQAGEARRKTAALVKNLGFNEVTQGKVGIVITEMANNLVRHARDGYLLVRMLEQKGDGVGVEILALDKGPGINNIYQCLQDGYSTAGTAGNGLGAMQRLADVFEIYSVLDQGTVILCQLWNQSEPELLSHSRSPALDVGAICLPLTGEDVSGDAWASQFCGDRHLLLVADGLGHGPQAAAASTEAVRIFRHLPQSSPPEILEAIHAALRSTRGAAVAIAEINLQTQTIHYAGIGNIAGCVLDGDRSVSMVSHNGTAGHEVRKIQAFTYPWLTNGVLVLHSDGLRTQWRFDRYPGLVTQHPSVIAGILYRDFNRGRDDVTVLVARQVT